MLLIDKQDCRGGLELATLLLARLQIWCVLQLNLGTLFLFLIPDCFCKGQQQLLLCLLCLNHHNRPYIWWFGGFFVHVLALSLWRTDLGAESRFVEGVPMEGGYAFDQRWVEQCWVEQVV